MNFTKIVFIFKTPALNTDIETYSLLQLVELGYQIYILDASPILQPEAHYLITASRLSDNRFKHSICYSIKELENYIKLYADSACFVPMFNCHYEVRKVYLLLTKYKVFYGRITTARTEIELNEMKNIKKQFELKRLTPFHIYKAIYNRYGKKLYNYKNANFMVFGGTKHFDKYLNATPHNLETKIIKLHTWDYERFLYSKKYDNEGKEYCVYLDTYMPFHPDSKIIDKVDFTDDEKQSFVDDMNKIFDYIRQQYNLEVIIAAHPRANYNDKQNLYPNTKIEYGKTSQLVKGANLVIADNSNSIMFAIMAKLPLILLKLPVIKKIKQCEASVLRFAELTGALVVENASELPKDLSFSINQEKYDAVKSEYFYSGDNNGKSMWQNILDVI